MLPDPTIRHLDIWIHWIHLESFWLLLWEVVVTVQGVLKFDLFHDVPLPLLVTSSGVSPQGAGCVLI